MLLLTGASAPAWASGGVASATTLTVKSNGSAVSTVAAGSIVSLTAAVTVNGNPVTTGQVDFCNTGTDCTDINLLGQAQLTLTGTAAISFVPGIGSHSYTAVFIPSGNHLTSSSSASTLTVTAPAGSYTTTTTIAASAPTDNTGNYLLTATVTGQYGLASAPTGSVTFYDTSDNNSVLAVAPLSKAIGTPVLSGPTQFNADDSQALAMGDYNGDGILDTAVLGYTDTVIILLGNGNGTFTAAPGSGFSAGGGVDSDQRDIATADFNGDGKLDLIVLNNTGANSPVEIFLGNGNGTFGVPSTVTVGTNPWNLVVGDFNEDGNEDFAVTNSGDSTISVFLGSGQGNFTQAQGSPISVSGSSDLTGITAAHLAGTGHLDLAVTDYDTNMVYLLDGNGDGTFTPAASSPVGANDEPGYIVSADFNGDGVADLAIANYYPREVAVLLNNADTPGTFTQATGSPFAVPSEDSVYDLKVADFNQDGIPDLVVGADTDYPNTFIFLGDGTGKFAAPTASSYTPGEALYYVLRVGVGDFNGDGVPDIMTANDYTDQVSVFLTQLQEVATATALSVTATPIGSQNVDASYSGTSSITGSSSSNTSITGVPVTTTTLVVSAASNVGTPITTIANPNAITLTATVSGLAAPSGPGPGYRGANSHTSAHPRDGSPSAYPGQVEFCDATAADCFGSHLFGTAQLTTAGTATISLTPGIGSYKYKAVFLVNEYGAGSVSTAQPLTVTGNFPTTTQITNVSGSVGDYTLDALVVGNGNVPTAVGGTVSFIDLSNGSALVGTAPLTSLGTQNTLTTAPQLATGYEPYFPVVGDFNGDGIQDLVVMNYEDESLTIELGTGDGTFTAMPVEYGYNSPFALTVGDFNGDGIQDLAVGDYDDEYIQIFVGNGDGTFNTSNSYLTGVSFGPTSVVTADFNGDGNADVAVTSYDYSNVAILLGNGDGTFAAPSYFTAGDDPSQLVVGDFNGDGRPDLAVGAYDNNYLSIALGNGDGTFTVSNLTTPDETTGLTIGDFNGDHIPDIAAFAGYDGAISGESGITVLLGKGDGTFNTPVLASVVPEADDDFVGIGSGDFNRDGNTDLIVATQNSVAILYGDGTGNFTTPEAPTASAGEGAYSLAVGDFNGDGNPDVAVANTDDSTVSVLLDSFQEGAGAELTHVSVLGSGRHNIVASYGVTAPYGASVSTSVPLTAAIGSSAVKLTASPSDSSQYGDAVTLTATLTHTSTDAVVTDGETITFFNGTTSLGTATLTGGVATLKMSNLPVGTDSLTASYPGDASLSASKSGVLSYSVTNNTLTIALQGGTETEVVDKNGTATYAFMVTPGGASTFGDKVTFSVSGTPSGMTATFNPTSLAAGTGAATVTLTVTSDNQASLIQRGMDLGRGMAPVALGMLLLPFTGRLRRSGKQLGRLLCLALLMLAGAGAVTGMTGCGSSGTKAYQMTVTATSGNVSKSTTVTVTVK